MLSLKWQRRSICRLRALKDCIVVVELLAHGEKKTTLLEPSHLRIYDAQTQGKKKKTSWSAMRCGGWHRLLSGHVPGLPMTQSSNLRAHQHMPIECLLMPFRHFMRRVKERSWSAAPGILQAI